MHQIENIPGLVNPLATNTLQQISKTEKTSSKPITKKLKKSKTNSYFNHNVVYRFKKNIKEDKMWLILEKKKT